MKSHRRSLSFFKSVASAAGVPAFLFAAAALGVSAVPARAANVVVYDRENNLVASGDSLDAVKSAIANDATVVLSGDAAASGSLLQVPVTTVPISFWLTVKSAVTGSPKTCVNTADAYLFSDTTGLKFSLQVRDVVFSGGAGIIRSKWDVLVDALNSTFSGNNSTESSGGAIYSSGNVEFAETLTSQLETSRGTVTFTGNTANGAPNDVYAGGNVEISDKRRPYFFDGGIVARGCFDVSGYSDVTFKGGAVNAITDEVTISGHSSATFANDGEGASNTFKGGLLLLEGSTIKIGTSAAEGETPGTVKFAGAGATLDFTNGTLVFEDGAKLALSGVGLTMKVENWSYSASNAITLGAGTTLELTGTNAQTVNGAITLDGAGAKFSATGVDLALGDVKMSGGEISATGDLTVSGAITDGAGTGAASGTLSGANVTIDLSAQTQPLTSALAIKATDSAAGTLTFTGAAGSAGTPYEIGAALTAKTLVVGGADGTSTNVRIASLGGIYDIAVNAGGSLTVNELANDDVLIPNTLKGDSLVVTNAGTLNVETNLGLGLGAALAIVGNGDDNVANFAGIYGYSGSVELSAGAHVKVSGNFALDISSFSVSLAGNSTLEATGFQDYNARTTISVESGSTLTIGSDATINSALTLGGALRAGTLADGAFSADKNLEIKSAIANGAGTISAKNVSLNGLYGETPDEAATTSVTATGTLTLGGETKTTGTLSADTIRLLSDAALTADFSKISVGNTLAVNMDATATLTIDTAGAVVDKLQVDGAVTLTGGNAFSLETLRGSGTVEKTGAGALTLGASADFAGTLKISEGAAVLGAGQTFGLERSRLEFLSEGKTFTAHDGAAVAGTLALGAGTTLELGGRDAKATVSVGALVQGGASAQAFSLRARNASAGTATIVHDVYSANEYDVLRVAGTGVDLSFATALLRAGTGLDVSALAAVPDGVTLTLVEGDVAHGYGALVLADGPDLVNIALSADGTTASAGLGAAALAAGVFPLETTSAQRATAQAATRSGTASGYGAALNALTNPHDTLAALDALGAGHAAAMMPAQIDGAWNRLRSVMNAAGTGARLGSETELAAWAQYAGSWTDVDLSRERASWTRRMHGAHAGVERAFASGWTAGAALGFEDSEQKVGGAKIGDDALSASLYARRTQDAFTQTAALSFARHDYETRRTVAFPGYAARTRGDTLGFTAALSYEASYAFAVADWAKLSPVASLSAAWNTIEGWTESGADAALRCGDQDALTWLASVGGRADFEFANPFAEAKARAGAYALFTAEFGERSCGVDAEFADTGAGFTARYDDPSRYALQLGVTASLPLSGNTSLFGGVSTELREDETNLNANLGVRFTW